MTIFRKWKHFVRETKLLHQLNKRRPSYKVQSSITFFSPHFHPCNDGILSKHAIWLFVTKSISRPLLFFHKKALFEAFFLSHRTSTKAFDVSEEFVVWGRVISSNLCFSTLGHSRGFSLPKARGFHNIN